jgi:hypothetical protein
MSFIILDAYMQKEFDEMVGIMDAICAKIISQMLFYEH